MITDNLTNNVYFSDLLPKKCPTLNQHIAEALEANGVRYAYLSETKDIWCRDFMPIQIEEDRFVSYRYTPDYLQDNTGLRLQTNPIAVLQASQNRLTHVLQNSVTIDLILDGGNVAKCGNTIVMTEKVFFENKDKTRAEVERILKDTFQKALEKHFDVIPLKYETKRQHARSWAYINFLQVGKLVLVPQLGLEEDEQALEQIGNALPNCEVIGISALEAVRRGGALNCISWNIKTSNHENTKNKDGETMTAATLQR